MHDLTKAKKVETISTNNDERNKMQKAKVTVKGLGRLSLTLAITRIISDIQYNYPEFKVWVGGVMVVFVTMYVGAFLVTRGTTRD